MCISGKYLSTTKKKKYKAYRFFRFNGQALCSVFYGGEWRSVTHKANTVSQHTGGNYGLHSLATKSNCIRRSLGKIIAEVEVSGTVARFGSGGRIIGYLSSRQKIKRIFVRYKWQTHTVQELRKLYKVPVTQLTTTKRSR